MSTPEATLPTPEEEIEAVLPADVLASLDEPIDGDEEEDAGGEPGRGTGAGGMQRHGRRARSRGHRRSRERDDVRRISTADHGLAGPRARHGLADARATRRERLASEEHHGRHHDDAHVDDQPAAHDRRHPAVDRVRGAEAAAHRGCAERAERAAALVVASAAVDARRPLPLPSDLRGPSVKPAAPAPSAAVLGPFDGRRFFGEAIARRATGALCFESEGVVRRIVMREGDLVAAASGGEGESLVHFLAARGELPRDEAPRLAAKIPPYGRHAGAALVAHGWLRQDQLWQVLRAHAEWIASAVLRLTRGTAQLEPDPPGRLRGEPSVFGAATGAEIFVDLVRRAVPHEDALERLGGESSRITDGPNSGLLAECNLPPQDLDLLHRARGGTIADLLARATDGEIVAVVHALALLGVIEVVPSPDFARRDARSAPDVEMAALDEDAIRARVRARLELVEEGDYFAVLGVTRDATGYEIRRAFIELRRTFEPSRILTPRLLDLADDVRKIVVVIEEAYEILRDNARRERYRRAIDARPE